MISLWPEWLRPLWLLAVPILVWLLWMLWHRQRRSGRWQQLLPIAFQKVLLKGGSGHNSRQPWIALGLAWLLAILALLGPSWQHAQQSNEKPADPLVIVLDLTPSMLATDHQPTRLEQAKRKILDLLRNRPDSQTAIVVYAGSTHTVVPLSDDLATSANLLESLKPSLMPTSGQQADFAVERALQLLKQAQLGRGRILLITSALSASEENSISRSLNAQPTPLLILGVGTREGAPIVSEDGSFLKDERGSIVIPRLDATGLTAFAQKHNGRYANMTLNDNDLRRLGLLDSPQALSHTGEPTLLEQRVDQGYWLLLPLLLMAALAGRRGWLLCLPLLLISLPQTSYAMQFDDLWLRPDQQGQRLLDQQRPAEAAQRFSDTRWQGKALYEAGNYSEAAKRFAHGDQASDHYNRGNALAKSGELEAALDAYEQALERDPDLTAALNNKALIEQLLEQKKQQEGQNAEQEQSSQQQDQQDSQSQAGQSADSNADAAAENNPAQNSPAEPSSDEQNSSEQSQNEQTEQAPEAQPSEQDQTSDEQGQQPEQTEQPGNTENSSEPAGQMSEDELGSDSERQQATEQWLRQIPDDPGELLRRKFRLEQQQRQESRP